MLARVRAICSDVLVLRSRSRNNIDGENGVNAADVGGLVAAAVIGAVLGAFAMRACLGYDLAVFRARALRAEKLLADALADLGALARRNDYLRAQANHMIARLARSDSHSQGAEE